MNTFGPPKLTLVRGEGAHVWDDRGDDYLDLLGGIAVNALGHGHPALVEAVTTQLQTLGHVSNFFAAPPRSSSPRARRAARRRTGEGLLLQLRHRGQRGGVQAGPADRAAPGRARGQLPWPDHGGARPDGQGGLPDAVRAAARRVTFCPFGDLDALAAAVTDETAAILLEPIQGEGGVNVPPEGYLDAARRRGRTQRAAVVRRGADRHGPDRPRGSPTSTEWGRHPDVVTLAKGLAGGFPIGA